MKNFVRLLLCLALAGFAISRAISRGKLFAATAKTEKNATVGKANAKTLLADAKKALAAMIKAARADKELDPKTAKNKPFWKSVHLIAQNLKLADKGLAAKSEDFFKGIAVTRRAEEQMKIDWELTDSKNKQVVENGKKLGHALAILRMDFSKEAARKKKGGNLTAQEKAEFAKIKADQKTLLGKIKEVEKEAKTDKALEKGLHEIQKQANHILKEPETVDAYIATLYLLDVQVGLVRGYRYYVDKNWREDWFIIDQLEANYESSYYAWETVTSYEWASLDVNVDIQEGENVDVTETVSDAEISSEENYVENESFDLNEAEEDEVASEEDTDEEVASDDGDSMEDESDDEGEDMSDDEGSADDDSGDMDDSGGDDSGDDGD